MTKLLYFIKLTFNLFKKGIINIFFYLNSYSLDFKLFNFVTLKLIVLFCTLAYLIFFAIFSYLLYKSYLLAVQEIAQYNSFAVANDLAKLMNKFPLLNNQFNQIPNETIQLIYKINGFNNYSEFIYLVNTEVQTLHSILSSNPEVASKYSTMIIQDIINNNYREIAELSEHLIKRVVTNILDLKNGKELISFFDHNKWDEENIKSSLNISVGVAAAVTPAPTLPHPTLP